MTPTTDLLRNTIASLTNHFLTHEQCAELAAIIERETIERCAKVCEEVDRGYVAQGKSERANTAGALAQIIRSLTPASKGTP